MQVVLSYAAQTFLLHVAVFQTVQCNYVQYYYMSVFCMVHAIFVFKMGVCLVNHDTTSACQ